MILILTPHDLGKGHEERTSHEVKQWCFNREAFDASLRADVVIYCDGSDARVICDKGAILSSISATDSIRELARLAFFASSAPSLWAIFFALSLLVVTNTGT